MNGTGNPGTLLCSGFAYIHIDAPAVPVADRPELQRMYRAVYDESNIDVIIVPTTAVPATPIDATEPYTYFKGDYLPNRSLLRVTAVIEPLVGAPSLSIPVGLTTSQLPVGLQLAARPGMPAMCIAICTTLPCSQT